MVEGSSCKQVRVGPTFFLPAGAPRGGKALGVAHLMLSLLLPEPLCYLNSPRGLQPQLSAHL